MCKTGLPTTIPIITKKDTTTNHHHKPPTICGIGCVSMDAIGSRWTPAYMYTPPIPQTRQPHIPCGMQDSYGGFGWWPITSIFALHPPWPPRTEQKKEMKKKQIQKQTNKVQNKTKPKKGPKASHPNRSRTTNLPWPQSRPWVPEDGAFASVPYCIPCGEGANMVCNLAAEALVPSPCVLEGRSPATILSDYGVGVMAWSVAGGPLTMVDNILAMDPPLGGGSSQSHSMLRALSTRAANLQVGGTQSLLPR